MLTVRQAAFRRMADRGGRLLAEIEVQTEDTGSPQLLAYFRKGPKDYQLVQVLSDDADPEIDAYDNNMHQAYEDVTMRLFSGPSHAAPNDRNEFASQVLGTNGLRQTLDLQFANAAGGERKG